MSLSAADCLLLAVLIFFASAMFLFICSLSLLLSCCSCYCHWSLKMSLGFVLECLLIQNCYRDEKITKSASIDTRTHIQRDTNEQKDCVNLKYQKINIRFRIPTLSNTLFCLLAKIFGQNKHTRTHILAQSPYNPTNDIKATAEQRIKTPVFIVCGRPDSQAFTYQQTHIHICRHLCGLSVQDVCLHLVISMRLH